MSELQCRINPKGFDQEYLKNLNVAFGSWGGKELFDWVFHRSCGSFEPEQLVLYEGDEVLAGSGISYRKLALPHGVVDVGIMTGSWTLPAARGRGAFARCIRESVSRCEELGCAMLLAFVTHDNPSRYALEKAGAAMFPSRYIFSDASWAEKSPIEVTSANLSVEDVARRVELCRMGSAHFVYPEIADFRGQFFQRVHPSVVVRVGTALAIIEKTETTDRLAVLALESEEVEKVLESLASASAYEGRRFFGFWMGDEDPRRLDYKPGFLTAIPAERRGLDVSLGSPMAGQADDIWLTHALPKWIIDSGDRM